jgi:PAS domain S-box-containing protein
VPRERKNKPTPIPSPIETRAGTSLDRVAADALAAIVQSSDDAIYSKNEKAIVTSWNSAAERLYGYSAEEAIGQSVAILIPPDRQGEETEILTLILSGNRVEHYETVRLSKFGELVDVSISVSPVHDPQGRIVGAAIISRDIREQKRLRAALADAREAVRAQGRKQALELNDEVVQGLAVAKLAIEAKEYDKGLRAVAATLGRAKEIVNRLLAKQHETQPLEPGDLVRDRPSRPLEDD